MAQAGLRLGLWLLRRWRVRGYEAVRRRLLCRHRDGDIGLDGVVELEACTRRVGGGVRADMVAMRTVGWGRREEAGRDALSRDVSERCHVVEY